MSRILVVEDSRTQAEELRFILEGDGFEVEVAPEGAAALCRLAEERFDLVVTDIVMPGLSGYDLCRTIKDHRAWRGLPVILMTNLREPEDIMRGIACGADNFIPKPYHPVDLLARIRTLLANRALRAENRLKVGVEVFFLGERFTITSEKEQLLDVLVSTCEEMVRTNRELQAVRDRLEAHAQEADARLAAIVESSTDAILSETLDGTITSWNAAAHRLFGYTAEEVLGRSTAFLAGPDRPEETEAILQQIRRGERVEPFETVWLRKDGSRVDVSLSVSPIRDGQGRVVGAARIARDVSGRNQAAAALRESETRYRWLFERNVAGVLLTRGDGTILDANDALARIFGLASRGDLLGRRMPEFYFDPAERKALLEAVVTDQALSSREVRFRRADGSEVWTLANISLLEEGPNGPVFHTTLFDITERRKLEEQFLQSQKMEAIGRLAGGVAHDFNNLLTVINGYGEIALSKLAPGDTTREVIEEMSRAGERAAGLTRQLLAFSRQQVAAPQVLNLNTVLGNLEKLLHRVIGEDVSLVTRLKPNLGWVKADPGQIEQVVMNLVVNARDAMPTGGKLTIETTHVELDAGYARSHAETIPGRYVLLAVSDTGCGMTEEVQARIFEPFFTTKEMGRGTGLGLATVFGIVKQSGGSIEVYSEPGLGATFKVYLPRVAVVEATPRPSLMRPPPAGGHETILLVEDEDGVRALSRTVLLGRGYNVLEAVDGLDALQVAEKHHGVIHLLMSDVVMPNLGGRELAERLLALHPYLKVLFTSGYTDDAVVRHGILHEKVNFLQKPFSTTALAHKVREVLDAGA